MESRREQRAGAGGQEPPPQEGQGGGGDQLGGARVLAFLDWGGGSGAAWSEVGRTEVPKGSRSQPLGQWPCWWRQAGPAPELSKQGVRLEVWQLVGKGRMVWVPKQRAGTHTHSRG